MTEDQVERRVEGKMDRLDRRFMGGRMLQDDYNKAVQDLNAWAEREGDHARRVELIRARG